MRCSACKRRHDCETIKKKEKEKEKENNEKNEIYVGSSSIVCYGAEDKLIVISMSVQ